MPKSARPPGPPPPVGGSAEAVEPRSPPELATAAAAAVVLALEAPLPPGLGPPPPRVVAAFNASALLRTPELDAELESVEAPDDELELLEEDAGATAELLRMVTEAKLEELDVGILDPARP
jgi:hypothetical protein